MPVAVTYPGVYVEEIPSGVRTIVGVATSIAAFVDNFSIGPLDTAVQVLSLADFENQFGGLNANSEASYGIQQFFLNGGTEAYVVRVGSGTAANAPAAANIGVADKPKGTGLLVFVADSPGAWGNNIRLDIDYGTTDPTTMFNVVVTEVAIVNGRQQVVATEAFRNLVIDPTKPNDAAAAITAGSQLVNVTEASGSSGKLPAATGTVSGASPDLTKLAKGDTMDVSLNGTKLTTTPMPGLPDPPPSTMASLASTLQSLVSAVDPKLAKVTFSVVGNTSTESFLVVKTGSDNPADWLTFSDTGSGLATKLGFGADGQNVQQYALGGAAVQAQVLAGAKQQSGSDGKWDPAGDATGVTQALIGNPAGKTGMYALLDVDLFNILCLPATANLPDVNAASVASAATTLCTTRRAFYILDVPEQDQSRDKVQPILDWIGANSTLRSSYSALYFPRIDIPDPLNAFRLRATPPSGTMAGLYARTDTNRGVWKAPAGTEATLTNVQKLEYKLTDPENGVLNPLAINCLRNFPIYGPVSWGARTLNGADQMSDDYKYIPVRRLALYIEESLYRGTQWVVFEPNDEPLWAQIRLNVGSFMHDLFRKGAFQGQTPTDAYFVKCDNQTTTQNDINLGIVNVSVGFAPLKPAEFVVIQIQQMAGQIQT
ncbi:MAG: phage tail sheath C-terminal domain-containing protein [Candidatus Korobacteraceae bacterium]